MHLCWQVALIKIQLKINSPNTCARINSCLSILKGKAGTKFWYDRWELNHGSASMILSHYMLWVTTKSAIIKSSGTGPTYQFQTDNNVTKKGNKIKASCIILGFLVFFICVKGQKGNLEKKESVSFSKPPPDVSRAMEPQAMPKKQHIQPHKGQHQAFCTVFKLFFFLKKWSSLDVLICTMQIHLHDFIYKMILWLRGL